MIYVTGDLHIPDPMDMSKLNRRRFPQQKELTREDFVIICGDFGGVWSGSRTDEYWLDWLESKRFTTLFVDGNHENFERLYAYPRELWNGGSVHRIRPHVLHLMRGQVFTLEGMKFFTMGGASSHDRECRTEYVNWWRQELPSQEEYAEALENLQRCGFSVDYVITHCLPDGLTVAGREYPPDALTGFLAELETRLAYRHWYCGHYHKDCEVDETHTVLMDQVRLLFRP